MRAGFVWRVLLPIVLGVLASLWIIRGDTSPDASEAFLATVTPHTHTSYDFDGHTYVVELRFSDGSAVTVMGSDVVPVMRYLLDRDGTRLDLEARPRARAVLTREGGR
jgi:hypothetical protein